MNLIDLEAQAASRMHARLDTHLGQQPLPRVVGPNVRIHPARAEKLRALGYGT